jgi:hypothetical protein
MLNTVFNATHRKLTMSTSFKTAAFIATAVIAAHAAIGAFSASALQTAADQAVMPIVKAEPIIVSAKGLQIVKADRIEVRPMQIVKAERIEIRAAV